MEVDFSLILTIAMYYSIGWFISFIIITIVDDVEKVNTQLIIVTCFWPLILPIILVTLISGVTKWFLNKIITSINQVKKTYQDK